MEQYFLEAFEGMERFSPGSTGSTLFATKSISRNSEVDILEIGCGAGTSALLLAQAFPKARIIAIDSNKEYIRQLGQRASSMGLAQQVQGIVMSMEQMQFPEGQFDVILSEGSAYITGFETALEQWKKYLRPDGQLLINDLCWLKEHIPTHCLNYWREQYPDINTVRARRKLIEEKGYEIRSVTEQPVQDWTENYYKPLSQNLEKMAQKYQGNQEAMSVVKKISDEIQMYYKFAPFYTYVMFALSKKEI